jgi:hypothetical protein
MIKYILKCRNKHEFESWFSNSREYEKLKKKKLIECIFCKSTAINKTIMSPNITREKKKDFNTFKSREFIKINKDLIKLKVFVEKNFEFVGDKFPRQVRDIYYNNKKNKNIYGTVSSNERKELEEEGIELTSVPWVINKKN